MEIKALSKIAEKWGKNSALAGDAYREGVNNPRRSWADSAANADDARKQGLADADARDAFVKGVREAGDAKWKKNATILGPARFRQGVQNATPEFQGGFSQYHSVLSGLTLPPRGPKGSPENINRVAVIAEALHAEKVGK
ncbi:MAG: hypothetical protein NUV61_02880 [Candidatus Azambacteria bacterium]|nr:hypothetical protein [Candidatus Azambacteria bacterium]